MVIGKLVTDVSEELAEDGSSMLLQKSVTVHKSKGASCPQKIWMFTYVRILITCCRVQSCLFCCFADVVLTFIWNETDMKKYSYIQSSVSVRRFFMFWLCVQPHFMWSKTFFSSVSHDWDLKWISVWLVKLIVTKWFSKGLCKLRRDCEIKNMNELLLQKLKFCIHIVYNLWIGLLHSDGNKIFQREAWIIFVTFIYYNRISSLRTNHTTASRQALMDWPAKNVDQELVHK